PLAGGRSCRRTRWPPRRAGGRARRRSSAGSQRAACPGAPAGAPGLSAIWVESRQDVLDERGAVLEADTARLFVTDEVERARVVVAEQAAQERREPLPLALLNLRKVVQQLEVVERVGGDGQRLAAHLDRVGLGCGDSLRLAVLRLLGGRGHG